MNHLRQASGPAAAQVPGLGLIAQTALDQVKGILQTAVSIAATGARGGHGNLSNVC